MNEENSKDFTPIFIKIFKLTNAIYKLRNSFTFSKQDSRARKDSEFIKKWREIENS